MVCEDKIEAVTLAWRADKWKRSNKEISEEDKLLIQKEIDDLKASIAKRKGLLANSNFVSKAPSHLVEQEREKLAMEEEKLQKLEQSF